MNKPDKPVYALRNDKHIHENTAAQFAAVTPHLTALLPAAAQLLHIGATSIPDCLTAGGLDIAVRVPDADFEVAQAALGREFATDPASVQTMDFAAFAAIHEGLPLSLRLTVIDGPFDHLHLLGAALLAHPAMLDGYNELKQMFDGQPLETAKAGKALFINAVLDGIARGEIAI